MVGVKVEEQVYVILLFISSLLLLFSVLGALR